MFFCCAILSNVTCWLINSCTQKGMLCSPSLNHSTSPTNNYASSLSNPMFPTLVDEKRRLQDSPSSESDDGSDSSSANSSLNVHESLVTDKSRNNRFIPIPTSLTNDLSDGTNTASSYSYCDFDDPNDPVTFYRNDSFSCNSTKGPSHRDFKTQRRQEFRHEKNRPIIRYHDISRFQQDDDDSILACSATFDQQSMGNRSERSSEFKCRVRGDENYTVASNSLLSYLGDDENSDLTY